MISTNKHAILIVGIGYTSHFVNLIQIRIFQKVVAFSVLFV